MRPCPRPAALILALLICFILLPAAAQASSADDADPETTIAEQEPVDERPASVPSEEAYVTDGEADLPIDELNFPDDVFRAYVRENLDPDRDGFLTGREISRVTRIICTYCDAASLEGVRYFTALETLACYGCTGLTALDLSGCEALETLACNNCALTEIDLSGCKALEYLNCADNRLTELDVTGCLALQHIECNGNRLTVMDAAGCPALEYLNCTDNELTELDVTGCSVLRDLVCRGNRLTALTLCSRDVLNWFDCADNDLTGLDVTGCPRLVSFDCSGNRLTGLDVTGCSALLDLACYGNDLSILDVSPCPSLADAVLNGTSVIIGDQRCSYSPVTGGNFMDGFFANVDGALKRVYSILRCDASAVVAAVSAAQQLRALAGFGGETQDLDGDCRATAADAAWILSRIG